MKLEENFSPILLMSSADTLLYKHYIDEIMAGEIPKSLRNSPPIAQSSTNNNWAIIDLSGLIMRGDIIDYETGICYKLGTDSIEKLLEDYATDNTITGVVLKINSPGGYESAVRTLPEYIQNYSKPTLAYIDGMACSAAMYIAASCSKIVARTKSDRIGCVGTMTSYLKISKDSGFEIKEIYASTSPKKNEENRALDLGNERLIVANVLDPMNKVFTDFMKENRPNLSKDALEGKTYFAQDAIEAGLIDNYGISLQQAVQQFKLKPINLKNIEMTKFEGFVNHVAKAFKGEATDEELKDSLQEAQTELKQKNSDLANIKLAKETAETNLLEKETLLSSLETAKTTAENRILELESALELAKKSPAVVAQTNAENEELGEQQVSELEACFQEYSTMIAHR